MKILRKYLEISFLFVINLMFFSTYFSLFVGISIASLIGSIIGINFAIQEEYDSLFGVIVLLVNLAFIVVKIFLFPLLYSAKNIFPYTQKWFNEIFATKNRTFCVFFTIIMLMMLRDIGIVIFGRYEFKDIMFNEFIFGLSLLPSYILMYIYLKLKNKK